MADFGFDPSSIIREIASEHFSMFVAFEISNSMFQSIISDAPSLDNIKFVANKYGHWSFVQSIDKYTTSKEIVSNAINLFLLVFTHSNTHLRKKRLWKNIEDAESFQVISETQFVLNGTNTYTSSSNMKLYKAYWEIHHYTDDFMTKATNNECESAADLFDHLETVRILLGYLLRHTTAFLIILLFRYGATHN